MERWRKSTLKSLLEGCSWQYALEKIYNVPSYGSPYTALGTGFHAGVEHWENSGREADQEEVANVAADAAFKQAKLLPMDNWFEHELDPQWVVDSAREAVRLWYEEPYVKGGVTLQKITEGRECLGTEVYLEADHPDSDRGLQGTVDGLYRDEYGITVVDFKTASSFRKWVYDQPPSIEASAYLWMVSQNYDAPQYTFEWHIVSPKTGKTRLVSAGNMFPGQLEKLSTSLREADVLVKYNAFRPNPDWNLCQRKWCAFYEGCQVDGSLSPTRLPISAASTSDAPSV
jgi:hypothetical protein